MEQPRPEKVAVVTEVREKLESSEAVLLTEYRGLKVAELAELRSAMRAAGGEYRIYKNTLVRLAAADLDLAIEDQLVGPTAMAFVTASDGAPADVAGVAKAITEFAKANPLLVLKGGLLSGTVLDADAAKALASLPSAAEIYSRLAGGLAGGARGLAGALSGVHRSLAQVLQAAIDAGAFAGDAAATAPTTEDEASAEPEAPTPGDPADSAEPGDPADSAEQSDPADSAEQSDPADSAEQSDEQGDN